MRFEFATAGRILFGSGTIREVPKLVAARGKSAILLSDGTAERRQPLEDALRSEGVDCLGFPVIEEPSTDLITEAAKLATDAKSRVVVSVGGGSVIDTGKAVAALLSNGGSLLDYLEVIGKGAPLLNPAAPHVAIPTTAGTGAEVTMNAVLFSPEHRVKVSMRSPHMLPTLAVVDPCLTHTMPPEVTAATGLDALTQNLEAFVSNKANPLTDGITREGMIRAGRSLRKAFRHSSNAEAREDMALASLCGGLALANSKLGAVHGFAGPIGGMFKAPHGALCARLLPFCFSVNVKALRERAPQSDRLKRFEEAARILTGNPGANVEEGIDWIQQICMDLSIPPLRSYGITEKDFPEIVEKSYKSSSMKGNPVDLSREEMEEILRAAT